MDYIVLKRLERFVHSNTNAAKVRKDMVWANEKPNRSFALSFL
jgi:hypothetical protein